MVSFKTPIMIYEVISYHSYLIYSAKNSFSRLFTSNFSEKCEITAYTSVSHTELSYEFKRPGKRAHRSHVTTFIILVLFWTIAIYIPVHFHYMENSCSDILHYISFCAKRQKENKIGLEREQLNDLIL